MTVTATGFQKYTANGVVLNVGSKIRVDVPLTVGSVSEEIVVTGESVAQVETTSAALGTTVSGNQIIHNVISNCTGLPWEGIPGEAIHDLYGGAPGTGNSFHDNLLYKDPGGVGPLSAVQAYNNGTGNPQYVNAGAHNYRLLRTSPAAGWGLWPGA